MLYPQNGDHIVTINSVTSLHPMYSGSQAGDATAATCLSVTCHPAEMTFRPYPMQPKLVLDLASSDPGWIQG